MTIDIAKARALADTLTSSDTRLITLAASARAAGQTILDLIQERDLLARDAARLQWLIDVVLDFDGTAVRVHEFVGPVAYGMSIVGAIDDAITGGKR